MLLARRVSVAVSLEAAAAHAHELVMNVFVLIMRCLCGCVQSGGFITSWKRRWFVLSEGVLNYYKSPSDGKPKGSVSIADCVAIASMSSVESNNRKHCFKLVTAARTLVCQADSADGVREWVTDLLRVHGILVGLNVHRAAAEVDATRRRLSSSASASGAAFDLRERSSSLSAAAAVSVVKPVGVPRERGSSIGTPLTETLPTPLPPPRSASKSPAPTERDGAVATAVTEAGDEPSSTSTTPAHEAATVVASAGAVSESGGSSNRGSSNRGSSNLGADTVDDEAAQPIAHGDDDVTTAHASSGGVEGDVETAAVADADLQGDDGNVPADVSGGTEGVHATDAAASEAATAVEEGEDVAVPDTE